ncbi:MAG: DUF5615 family PIN-like protein [Lyngbya sp. HA4199-MV5]|jgi:hypothetical protein|nr:DUF5615 family PIN-like protein [Lyngbya sp. HA4199-MV5]
MRTVTLAALYTDEDMSALVATLLRSRGLDVMTVLEQATFGRTDREPLEFATSVSRCVLIHNRVDFERLHLQYIEAGKRHAGIMVVPQKNAYEIALTQSLFYEYLDRTNHRQKANA